MAITRVKGMTVKDVWKKDKYKVIDVLDCVDENGISVEPDDDDLVLEVRCVHAGVFEATIRKRVK